MPYDVAFINSKLEHSPNSNNKKKVIVPGSLNLTLYQGEKLKAVCQFLKQFDVTFLIADSLNRFNNGDLQASLKQGDRFLEENKPYFQSFKIARWDDFIETQKKEFLKLREIVFEKLLSDIKLQSAFLSTAKEHHQQIAKKLSRTKQNFQGPLDLSKNGFEEKEIKEIQQLLMKQEPKVSELDLNILTCNLFYLIEEAAVLLMWSQYDTLIYPRPLTTALAATYEAFGQHYKLPAFGEITIKSKPQSVAKLGLFGKTTSDEEAEKTSSSPPEEIFEETCERIQNEVRKMFEQLGGLEENQIYRKKFFGFLKTIEEEVVFPSSKPQQTQLLIKQVSS